MSLAETVNLSPTYTVLTPDGGSVTVNETRVVRREGQIVAPESAIPARERYVHERAGNRAARHVGAGVYEATTTIVAEGEYATQQTSFAVN